MKTLAQIMNEAAGVASYIKRGWGPQDYELEIRGPRERGSAFLRLRAQADAKRVMHHMDDFDVKEMKITNDLGKKMPAFMTKIIDRVNDPKTGYKLHLVDKFAVRPEATNEATNQAVIDSYTGKRENLNIQGTPGSLEAWKTVMTKGLADYDGTYNEFNVNKVYAALKKIVDNGKYNLQFTPAREGSVGLYVQSKSDDDTNGFLADVKKARSSLKWDELDTTRRQLVRIWWD